MSHNYFKKPFVQFITALIAISALTLSVIFSQSKEEAKKPKKKEPIKIFNSSKSMVPNPQKNKPEAKDNKPEDQTKNNQQEEDKKKLPIPIVPSSKAPAPGEY